MSREVFLIPLTNTPQKFDLSLSGKNLSAVTQWNKYLPAWVISFFDKDSSTPLIIGQPLITGADLLKQYEYVGIPGSLIAYTNGDEFAVPTYENLGQEANLYYITDDD